MPNRILREGILTSERIAILGWAAEVFYRRLHSIVDDYGRYEAGYQLLRAKCYPLQTDAVQVADVERWLAECQKAGLIVVYAAKGKQYLEVQDFRQKQRTPSKCPDPPAVDGNDPPLQTIASKVQQSPANASLGVCVFEGVCVSAEKLAPVAPDPIWGAGLSFLVRKGTPEKQARTFLGKLRKKAGDVELVAMLADAEAQDISDPIPWLSAAAVRSVEKPTSKSMQALQTLEALKHDGLAKDRNPYGLPEALLLESGTDAGR